MNLEDEGEDGVPFRLDLSLLPRGILCLFLRWYLYVKHSKSSLIHLLCDCTRCCKVVSSSRWPTRPSRVYGLPLLLLSSFLSASRSRVSRVPKAGWVAMPLRRTREKLLREKGEDSVATAETLERNWLLNWGNWEVRSEDGVETDYCGVGASSLWLCAFFYVSQLLLCGYVGFFFPKVGSGRA